MRKDRTEDKARVPVCPLRLERVRVVVLKPFEDHSAGESFEMEEGRKLDELIAEGMVRSDELPYEPRNAGS